ncbi:MAG: DsrE family protein [Clostridia bacterium]
MKKTAIFAFKGEMMCFIHVLLNALDLHGKGHDVRVVLEGEAVALVKELEDSRNPMYLKAKTLGLFHCVCKACSAKMGVLEYNKNCGIPLSDEMSGHPAMSTYIDQGYAVITM